jgi:hypothetical protein
LSGVKDFAVTVGKNIYAIGTSPSASNNAYTSSFDSVGNGLPYQFKQYPQSVY